MVPVDAAELDRDALAAAIATARACWPGVEHDDARFAAYLAERIDPSLPSSEAIAATDVAGLWLALACRDGDPVALATFERAFADTIARALTGVVTPGADGDDIGQRLRERLFVGVGEAAPAIERYAGRGPLGGWLRVMATRMRIDAERRRVDAPLPDRSAAELAGLAEDPELAYLAAHCREAFAGAIRAAFAALAPRQRNLLRLHLVRSIAVGGIAEVYAVHVSSVKRWLAEARAELIARAEAELRERLRADTRELESVLRVVHSRLELSLRVLIEHSDAG